MSIRVVRLGTPRAPDEGPRLGTVRRPPRGVPKAQFSSGNWYDVWFPNLAPSSDLVSEGLSADDVKAWKAFERKFTAEMKNPEPSRLLDLLAAMSHHTNFSVGCYCEDESRCHRSVLRALLAGKGADVEPPGPSVE